MCTVQTFWCVGCETDHPTNSMTKGLCPQCSATFNQEAKSKKNLLIIYLCFFGLGLIALAVIVGSPFS